MHWGMNKRATAKPIHGSWRRVNLEIIGESYTGSGATCADREGNVNPHTDWLDPTHSSLLCLLEGHSLLHRDSAFALFIRSWESDDKGNPRDSGHVPILSV